MKTNPTRKSTVRKGWIIMWPKLTTPAHCLNDTIAIFHHHKKKEAIQFAQNYTKTKKTIMKVVPCTITFTKSKKVNK